MHLLQTSIVPQAQFASLSLHLIGAPNDDVQHQIQDTASTIRGETVLIASPTCTTLQRTAIDCLNELHGHLSLRYVQRQNGGDTKKKAEGHPSTDEDVCWNTTTSTVQVYRCTSGAGVGLYYRYVCARSGADQRNIALLSSCAETLCGRGSSGVAAGNTLAASRPGTVVGLVLCVGMTGLHNSTPASSLGNAVPHRLRDCVPLLFRLLLRSSASASQGNAASATTIGTGKKKKKGKLRQPKASPMASASVGGAGAATTGGAGSLTESEGRKWIKAMLASLVADVDEELLATPQTASARVDMTSPSAIYGRRRGVVSYSNSFIIHPPIGATKNSGSGTSGFFRSSPKNANAAAMQQLPGGGRRRPRRSFIPLLPPSADGCRATAEKMQILSVSENEMDLSPTTFLGAAANTQTSSGGRLRKASGATKLPAGLSGFEFVSPRPVRRIPAAGVSSAQQFGNSGQASALRPIPPPASKPSYPMGLATTSTELSTLSSNGGFNHELSPPQFNDIQQRHQRQRQRGARNLSSRRGSDDSMNAPSSSSKSPALQEVSSGLSGGESVGSGSTGRGGAEKRRRRRQKAAAAANMAGNEMVVVPSTTSDPSSSWTASFDEAPVPSGGMASSASFGAAETKPSLAIKAASNGRESTTGGADFTAFENSPSTSSSSPVPTNRALVASGQGRASGGGSAMVVSQSRRRQSNQDARSLEVDTTHGSANNRSEIGSVTVCVALNEDMKCSYKDSKLSFVSIEGVIQVQLKANSSREEPVPPFNLVIRDPARHIKTIQESRACVRDVTLEHRQQHQLDLEEDLLESRTYEIRLGEQERYFPIIKYACSNTLCPVPLRVQTKVRANESRCRVALQVSSNPANTGKLSDLTISMIVPPVLSGETLTTSPAGGQWNPHERSVVWCIEELGAGEKFQLQAQFDALGMITPDELRFPVSARCQCMYSQLTKVNISVSGNRRGPSEVRMKFARRFRLAHRER